MNPKKRKASPSNAHQFKKNTSGNPKGRPRGSGKKDKDVDSPFAKIAAINFKLSIDGSEHSVSSEHLLERKILEAAMRGENKAIKTVFGWIAKREAYRAGKRAHTKSKSLVLTIEAPNPKNADRALQLLDIIGIRDELDPAHEACTEYVLEPWVVEVALSRRRGTPRLEKEGLEWLLAYTRDGKTVNLPRGYQYD